MAWIRGTSEDGTPVMELGLREAPTLLTIGAFDLPANVSTALATMAKGERRIVKAPLAQRGQKPQIVTFEIHLSDFVALSALEDEMLHGEECACGCHLLRRALAPR